MRFYFFFIIIGRERERVERVESREFSNEKKTTTLTLTLVIVVVYVAFLKTAIKSDKERAAKKGKNFYAMEKILSIERFFFSKSKSFLNPNKP